MDTLPFWPEAPCNNIRASEGSLFPPRALTGEDTVYVYDKDVCRTLPFTYSKPVTQNGMWEAVAFIFIFIFHRGVLLTVDSRFSAAVQLNGDVMRCVHSMLWKTKV